MSPLAQFLVYTIITSLAYVIWHPAHTAGQMAQCIAARKNRDGSFVHVRLESGRQRITPRGQVRWRPVGCLGAAYAHWYLADPPKRVSMIPPDSHLGQRERRASKPARRQYL